MKRCYYEILDVEKKAATSAIKAAYRKMALKYHPDKNASEEGKKIFLEVQEAYDVLSDANERTFYDNNRERILFNKDQMSKEDLEQYSFGFNIWECFTVRCFKGYNDDQGGFYHVYRDVFEKIKAQEGKAFKSRDDLQEQMRKYEGFGTMVTNIEKVLSFYDDWQNFTTYKTFAWSEQYDTRAAENRWVKRRMQEENKKERLKEKKTYIKTIKDLVSFVKKRDLRFQQHLAHMRQEQERKQKQKVKKQQDKKKSKEDMKKVKQTLEEERFRQIDEYYKKNNAPEEKTHIEYEDEQESDFYCPICEKSFKSQNQLENHQKSKIHKQNVRLLQKQVMLPGEKVQEVLKQEEEIAENVPAEKTKKKRFRKKKNQNNNQPGNQQVQKDEQQKSPQKKQPLKQAPQTVKPQNNKTKKQQSESSEEDKKKQQKNQKNQKNQKKEQIKPTMKQNNSDSSDDDDILISLAQNKQKKTGNNAQNIQEEDKKKKKKGGKAKQQAKPFDQESDQEAGDDEKKLGKAKLKKMKKAEQQKDTGLKCKTCSGVYPSKTKLFDHIKQSGHAAYKP